MTWSSTEINCTSSASMVSSLEAQEKRSNFKGTKYIKVVLTIVQGPGGDRVDSWLEQPWHGQQRA